MNGIKIKNGDRVYIAGSAEEATYKDCVFEVLSDPWDVCEEKVVKMKCHEIDKYFSSYATKFLRLF